MQFCLFVCVKCSAVCEVPFACLFVKCSLFVCLFCCRPWSVSCEVPFVCLFVCLFVCVFVCLFACMLNWIRKAYKQAGTTYTSENGSFEAAREHMELLNSFADD